MAKAKKEKKGGKRGGKKGKGEPDVIDPNILTEVDKTFYELQITDLNRKLARLRTLTQELELKNEELQTNLKTMDEDRGDIITFLKKTLQEKSDEIIDLQNRLQALQEQRQSEIEDFQAQIAGLTFEYKMMQEQLTSEIKLLNGKLNSLEEFRIQRDDLMRKYEIQEAAMVEQEIRHKREIYEIEKKFIIGKDRLKKEMEDRLLQLSCDFQDATNLRIAATTHRVIRENIAINNELDVILETHTKLYEENENLRQRDKTLRMETELHDAEKEKALAKSKVQYQLIQRLTAGHDEAHRMLDKYKGIEYTLVKVKSELFKVEKAMDMLNLKNKILEQNLHLSRCERVSLLTDLQYADGEVDRLTEILVHAVMSIKAAFKLEPDGDVSISKAKREDLLNNLLELLSKVYEQQSRKPSLETVGSFTATYKKGDLGFVPTPSEIRYHLPTKRNMDTQVGASLETLMFAMTEGIVTDKKEDLAEEEEFFESDDVSAHQRELNYDAEEIGSQVLFDDEPEPLSASSERGVEVNLLDLVDTDQVNVDEILREGDKTDDAIEGEELEDGEKEEDHVSESVKSEESTKKATSKVAFAEEQ